MGLRSWFEQRANALPAAGNSKKNRVTGSFGALQSWKLELLVDLAHCTYGRKLELLVDLAHCTYGT